MIFFYSMTVRRSSALTFEVSSQLPNSITLGQQFLNSVFFCLSQMTTLRDFSFLQEQLTPLPFPSPIPFPFTFTEKVRLPDNSSWNL